jgi:glycosyltransferase involved in cell wall biosynthesis
VTVRLAVVEAGSTGYEETLSSALERTPELEVVRMSQAPTKELAQELRRSGAAALLVTGSDRRRISAAATAARRAKVPALLRCDWRNGIPLGFLEGWHRRRTVRRFELVLSTGAANRRFLEACGLDVGKLEDAPNGIDLTELASAAATNRPRRRELREKLGLAPDWFCMVFVDPLEPEFRPMDVLEALAASRRDHSAHRLLILGSGPLESALRERARERRLPVTFAARRERADRLEACAAADVVVCPAEASVSWSTRVAEAMASGLAAVVSKKAGFVEDLIEEGVTGFTHDPGDSASLAVCLATLASDPIRAAVMGDAARIRASEFAIERTVGILVEAVSRAARAWAQR